MSRLPLLTTGPIALMLATSQAWAGPPPPPPPGSGSPSADGEVPASGGRGAPLPPPSAEPPPPSGPVDDAPPGEAAAPPEDPFGGQRTASEEAKASWSYSSGSEITPNYVREDRATILTINPIGFYQGVSIMGDHSPPFGATNTANAGAVLTWTGFERGPSSSKVFFQLSSAVAPTIETESLRVTVRMPQTSVKVKNNRRRLDTSFFRTPVIEVNLKRNGSETVATLMLRREAIPQWSVIPAANGYQMLVLEFQDHPELDTLPSQVKDPNAPPAAQPE